MTNGKTLFIDERVSPGGVEAGSHYLYPGMIFAHKERHLVTTVLGSCVSVVLIDLATSVGGINHYLLPLWNGEGLSTPKYGNIAVPRLLEKVISMGAQKKSIQAKVFGGASINSRGASAINVGPRNVAIAFTTLAELGVPVVSSDTGGGHGRKLIADTSTGLVKVKLLKGSFLTDAD